MEETKVVTEVSNETKKVGKPMLKNGLIVGGTALGVAGAAYGIYRLVKFIAKKRKAAKANRIDDDFNIDDEEMLSED